MTTINVGKTTFGNFQWTAQGEFETPVLEHLAMMGLVQILQRVPASAAEKKMAGYEKRPEGFKRDSIAYSEDMAETLRQAFEGAKVKIEEKEFPLGLVVGVEEYIPGITELKYKAEKEKIKSKNGDEEKLATLAETVGFEYEGTSELVPENIEFCKAIKAYIDNLLKTGL